MIQSRIVVRDLVTTLSFPMMKALSKNTCPMKRIICYEDNYKLNTEYNGKNNTVLDVP